MGFILSPNYRNQEAIFVFRIYFSKLVTIFISGKLKIKRTSSIQIILLFIIIYWVFRPRQLLALMCGISNLRNNTTTFIYETVNAKRKSKYYFALRLTKRESMNIEHGTNNNALINVAA